MDNQCTKLKLLDDQIVKVKKIIEELENMLAISYAKIKELEYMKKN